MKSYSLFSNIVFAFPTAVLFLKGYFLFGILVLFVLTSSLIYHLIFDGDHSVSNWNDWFNPKNAKLKLIRYVDWLGALVFSILNIYVFSITEFSYYSVLALILFSLAFFFFIYKWRTEYDKYHALWHFFSGIGSALLFMNL